MRMLVFRAYLGLGVLAVVLYVAIGGSRLVYQGVGALAAVAIGLAVARSTPGRRAPWVALCGSQALLAVGDTVYFSAYQGMPPYPSFADAFYLGGVAVFGVALLLFVSRSGAGYSLLSLLDAAVFSMATAMLLWAVLFSHSIHDGAGLAGVVSITYPAIELLFLTALLQMLLTSGVRTPSFWALAASVALLCVSDAWYVIPALTDQYVVGTWRDAGWLGSYVLAGAAALHPSASVFIKARRYDIPVRRVVLLGLSIVVLAIAAIVQQLVRGSLDVFVFAGVGITMALLITVRVANLVRTLERTRLAAEASERKFRMVFERAPIGISLGRDGIMSETNPAFQRMLGYSGDELASMHYTAVTHPDDRALAVQHELDDDLRDAFSIDKRYVHKDGHVVDVRAHVALDIDGGLGVSLLEDVTERRELARKLQDATKMEAVGKLAGGIAHDFNNLMTAVIGYSDLLYAQLADGDPRRAKVEAIRSSAVRASDLTRQLLAFGRRQFLQSEEIDLRDVVGGMKEVLRRRLRAGIEVETLFGAEPVVVRADGGQLERVVLDLGLNAGAAMPDGGTLTLGVVSDGVDGVLTVVDDGVGMDERVLARIFEPFFTTKEVGEGSGLGLSTVHGIVGQSGGSIDVSSAPGEGSAFSVRLPLVSPSALPDAPETATLVD